MPISKSYRNRRKPVTRNLFAIPNQLLRLTNLNAPLVKFATIVNWQGSGGDQNLFSQRGLQPTCSGWCSMNAEKH